MSSSHLFSLLCLYFSLFHDAKPEWEWTNLLLPERTEWAAAIRCTHTRDGGRDGLEGREGGRRFNGSQWKASEKVMKGGKRQIMGMNGDRKEESELYSVVGRAHWKEGTRGEKLKRRGGGEEGRRAKDRRAEAGGGQTTRKRSGRKGKYQDSDGQAFNDITMGSDSENEDFSNRLFQKNHTDCGVQSMT